MQVEVGDFIQYIWGGPGPDYDVYIVSKVHDDGSFSYIITPNSWRNPPPVETIKLCNHVIKVQNPNTLAEYKKRYANELASVKDNGTPTAVDVG